MEDMLRPCFSVLVTVLSLIQICHSFKMMNLPMASDNNVQGNENTRERKDLVFSQPLADEIPDVAEGTSLVLECEAVGQPAPTIHWLFDGLRVPQGRSHSVLDEGAIFEETSHNRALTKLQLGTTKSRLTLGCLEPKNAGLYTCVASTPRERIVTETYVGVDAVAGTEECESSLSGSPASIYMWETYRLEFEGVDVQLFCRASGFPMPHITWFDRNGDAITHNNPQYRLLKNGDLLIKSISWFEHMGQYRCRAQNSNGETEETSFLYPTLP